MSAIFLRGSKYLSNRYQWVDIPDLFPEWQFPAVLRMAMGFTQKPDGFAMVEPGVIDLDALEDLYGDDLVF